MYKTTEWKTYVWLHIKFWPVIRRLITGNIWKMAICCKIHGIVNFTTRISPHWSTKGESPLCYGNWSHLFLPSVHIHILYLCILLLISVSALCLILAGVLLHWDFLMLRIGLLNFSSTQQIQGYFEPKRIGSPNSWFRRLTCCCFVFAL